METQRNASLTSLIDMAIHALSNLAKWPDSESTLREAEVVIKALRKSFKEDGYPRAFLYMTMCQIAGAIYAETFNREVKDDGLRKAWMKIGELIGKA